MEKAKIFKKFKIKLVKEPLAKEIKAHEEQKALAESVVSLWTENKQFIKEITLKQNEILNIKAENTVIGKLQPEAYSKPHKLHEGSSSGNQIAVIEVLLEKQIRAWFKVINNLLTDTEAVRASLAKTELPFLHNINF